MLHDELREIREPVLAKVLEHPFWAGLRDGSLPPDALARFVWQDTAFLLPAYARALARCAAAAPGDADALLLGQSVVGTLTARDELRESYAALAPELGLPPLGTASPATCATQAYASFFAAASAHSFSSGIGACATFATLFFTRGGVRFACAGARAFVCARGAGAALFARGFAAATGAARAGAARPER